MSEPEIRNYIIAKELRKQQEIIQIQDNGLTELGKTIARQKELGLAIGDELSDQEHLLADLGDDMDHTHGTIERETKHIIRVSEKSKAGGLLCCILILILTIILVAAIPF